MYSIASLTGTCVVSEGMIFSRFSDIPRNTKHATPR